MPAALVAVTVAGCTTGQPASGSSPAPSGTVAAPTDRHLLLDWQPTDILDLADPQRWMAQVDRN